MDKDGNNANHKAGSLSPKRESSLDGSEFVSGDLISTPSTSPEPIESKENESPMNSNSKLMMDKLIMPEVNYSSDNNKQHQAHIQLQQQPLPQVPSSFPISSLLNNNTVGNNSLSPSKLPPGAAVSGADFLSTQSSFISSLRNPFYQNSVSLFDRNSFFREISMSSHFVPPFNSIKNSLFSAFNANDK